MSSSLVERLESATQRAYDAMDLLPFFVALESGRVQLDSYLCFLRGMYVIHEVFEGGLSQANSALQQVWQEGMGKVPLLESDLSHFKVDLDGRLTTALVPALEVASFCRLRVRQHPVAALGFLYALEGARLGGDVLRQKLERCFGLSDDGLAYVSCHLGQEQGHWEDFAQRLNALELDEDEVHVCLGAAREVLTHLSVFLRSLHPWPSYQMLQADTLNPAGGMYPITKDPRELQAALRAGERSLLAFPYYQKRYGERGRRFTMSDSAWLVTLAFDELPHIFNRINWLGRLLSQRGMPQWLLEDHLVILHEELCRGLPEKASEYRKLHDAAMYLREEREKVISAEMIDRLASAFEGEVGHEFPGMGVLIVSAVIDESNGSSGAVQTLCEWLVDPDSFSQEWIDAVHDTIKQARAAVS